MTVANLSFMILVLIIWILFVRYPYLQVDPSSLLGRIYYVCYSSMVKDLQGISLLREKQLTTKVEGLGKKYKLGHYVGVSDARRMRVDYASEFVG